MQKQTSPLQVGRTQTIEALVEDRRLDKRSTKKSVPFCCHSKTSNMKDIEMIFFCMAALCFSTSAYVWPLAKNSPTVHLQERIQNTAAQKHIGSGNIAGISITQQVKYAHGGGSHGHGAGSGGAQGGGSAAGGEGNGGGGGSGSRDPNGGASVIPVYAAGAAGAGAANNHRSNHHSAGSTNWSRPGSRTIYFFILASVIVSLREVLWV